MSNNYNKPALTVDEQIDLLASRGLTISHREKAQHYLNFINYYRLSGYTISFEQIVDGRRNHRFKNGVTFSDIIALYNFDRHLRMLVMDAIERIEVAIRAQICQVHKDSLGIYEYNIKTKGWISKPICLLSTKQGALDLHICISNQGHEYLRARIGSSVNGSLEKLVVKDPKKGQKQNSPGYKAETEKNKEKMDAVY